MILFLISFLMVFVSSYLLASIFAGKKYLNWLIYTLLIAFAQIIFTIELLSLFTAISKTGILILNTLILSGTLCYWNKKGNPLFKPQIKKFFIQIFNACKKDKMLGIMGLGLIFFILITIFLCAFCPIINYDGLAYRINRALVWASQGSLAHFDIADDRNINMAINFEILYTWFFTFIPKNMFLGFFTFAGYVLSVTSLYSFMETCGYCVRKRLWSVFLFSAIAGVITEASGCESDIVIGGLALACLTLFLQGAKKNNLIPIYFSSLAICLAVGAKTSGFFVIPSLALIFIMILLKYQKEKFLKYCKYFFLFSLVNFILFAAYNYIQNFIEFGHFIGSEGTRAWHQMSGGIKGYIAGLIRHFILLIDFTGFSYGLYIEKFIFATQNKLLTLLNIPLDLNVITSNDDILNIGINDSMLGGGVIGTLVLLPCAIIAIIKGFFTKNFKTKLLSYCGSGLFLSIITMSACIGFMLYSSRFTITFLILAAPVLVLSYIKSNKNPFKYIILFWVMSYLLVISTHIWSRHFFALTQEIQKGESIRDIRTKHLCSLNFGFDEDRTMFFCSLRSVLYQLQPSTIGIFSNIADNVAVIKFMENDGYKIDTLLIEEINNYDLSKYNYLIFTSDIVNGSYIKNKEKVLNQYYISPTGVLTFTDNTVPQCILMNEQTDTLITKKDNVKNLPIHISCNIPYNILAFNGFREYANIKHREISKLKKETNILTTVHIFKNKNIKH